MIRRLVPLLSLLVGSCAQAPAEVEDPEIAADALVAGVGLAGPVEVHDDRLVVPRMGNEALLDVRPGRVLVGGPRETRGSAAGFLRKATSSEADGDRIVVRTEPAALTDLVRSGDVDTRGVLEDPGAVSPRTVGGSPSVGIDIDDVSLLSVHASFKDPTPGGLLPLESFEIGRDVRIKHGHLRFRPSVTTSLAIRRGKLERFEAIARGELEASLDVMVDTKTNIDFDNNHAYEEKLRPYLRGTGLNVTLWESEPYVMPVQWIGVVPVIETVRVRIEVNCDVAMSAQMHAEASFRLRSAAAFGARFRNGEWSAAEAPTLDASSSYEMTRKGAFEGRCGLRGEVGFYFYDLAGPTLSLTPYLAFDTKREGDHWSYQVAPGIVGTFGGRLQVLGWELLRADVPLFDERSKTPLRGTW